MFDNIHPLTPGEYQIPCPSGVYGFYSSDHITPFESDFTILGDGTKYAHIADGNSIKMIRPGIALLKAVERKEPFTLTGVWFSPDASCHLLSTNQLALQGYKTTIGKMTNIFDKQGHLVIWASASSPGDILHWFRTTSFTPTGDVHTLQDVSSFDLWHYHFKYSSDNAL
jgi:hypothetical protein